MHFVRSTCTLCEVHTPCTKHLHSEMPWDPDRYHQFKNERSAPFEDLLRLVNVRPGLKVVDLGCGTGKLTRRLAEALPESDVLGLDRSNEMLARAREQSRSGLRFQRGDQTQLSGSFDLIFSNAALQWSDAHHELISYLFGCLNPGGQLLVQVPSNNDHVSQQTILKLAREQPFREALGGWTRRSPVLSIEAYAQLLHDLGAIDIVVFEKVYPHLLADAEAIVEWVSGTALVPYFERLGNLKEAFLEAYHQRLKAIWPVGPVFYPFKRTLFSAICPLRRYMCPN
jgi:trans-aconitate 2-methyltransferase